jgi:cysteine synthase A
MQARASVLPSVLGAIGGTPLVALDRLAAGAPGRVLAKLENLNPGGSLKDRIALRMIEAAEREGRLRPGSTVVELTSGNTGTGLAIVCAVRGYRFIAAMSEGNSVERRRMLRALGAEVVLVPQAPGSPPGQVSGEDLALVEKWTRKLVGELGAFWPDQFANPANPDAHEEGTGEEIWEQTSGRVDLWVSTVGTGGSFLGVARALKRRNPTIRTIAVEPSTAAVLGGCPVTNPNHRIQGIGYAEIPPQWDPSLCDGTIGIADEEAIASARLLATREGIIAGYSSGANVAAALKLAGKAQPGEVIVTLCNDTGLKYLSTDLYPAEPGGAMG